jgi:hypothetical protein
MFSFRSRFTYSNVVATLALVFAMSGGAFAASKYLITSTKQIKPSVLSSLKGKAGPAGTAGAAGPAGAVGSAGAAGAQGPAGPQGAAGENGAPGVEGKAGKNGTNGKEGSPWTAGGTLPVGSTETGVWTMGPVATGAGVTFLNTAISFSIPLASPIAVSNVHIFEGTTIPAGCSGTVVNGQVTELRAAPGNFCAWALPSNLFTLVKAEDILPKNLEDATAGMGTHGGTLSTARAVAEESGANGIWAVTG